MKVVCINSGSTKNLTEGNNYDVVRSTEDHYYVVNDRGITARYSSKLFKEEEVVPVPPPPPPAPVIRDVVLDVRNVKVSWQEDFEDGDEEFFYDGTNYYNGVIEITNPHHNGIVTRSFSSNFVTNTTNISCGVLEMEGFNALVNAIKSNLIAFKEELVRQHINLIFTPEVCKIILGNSLRSLINDLFEADDIRKGIINFSSNITHNGALTDFFGINEENISDLFDHCFTTMNPNSGNMIFFGSFTN